MKAHARLVVRGYWGVNTPAFPLALTGDEMLERAARSGAVRGLVRYNTVDGAPRPVGLARSLVLSPSDNQKEAWQDNSGSSSFLESYPRAFGGVNGMGVGHESINAASYTGPTIPQNAGFVVRMFLYKSEQDSITTLNWGRWQCQIERSGAYLMRLTDEWTQQAESEVMQAGGIGGASSPSKDAIIETIYADMENIPLDVDTTNTQGTFLELEFFPEMGGRISVFSQGKWLGAATDSEIMATRQPGVLWDDSPLTIRRNGGHFFWQYGYPTFASSGTIRWRSPVEYPIGSMSFQRVATTPDGTTIELSHDREEWDIIATFSTNNPRVTPLLYLAQAYIQAGDRNGSTDVFFDTDDHQDQLGGYPILDIEPMCESELRRAQYNVQLRDVEGRTLEGAGFLYEAFENRVADLYIGNQLIVKNGIVRQATITDFGSATKNQVRRFVARPDTCAQLEICDAWALLEEYELQGGELVGDGLYVGALLHRALKLIGTPDAELAGVHDGTGMAVPRSQAGRILPKAAIGEEWAVVNGPGTLADFVYYIVERFGMGRILVRGEDGIWYFRPRSRSVRELNGHEVHFKSDATQHNNPDSYPGRYTMLKPIDLARDTTEFYNQFRVEGRGYNDEPIVQEWTVYESFAQPNPLLRRYIGRPKPMMTVMDTSLRTPDDVQYVVRSLAEMYGAPPGFLSFKTYYHSGLFVGDYVKADGSTYTVRRISGGSWKGDEMYLLLQEVE